MKKSVYLLYPLCGILLALPMIVGEMWVLGWVMLTPILYLEYSAKHEGKHQILKSWLRGFIFYYSYSLITFYWFVELYPLDFTGLSPSGALAVVIAAWFGLPLLQAVPFAFFVVLLSVYCRKSKNKYAFPVLTAALWVTFEWVQTLTWAGVPWGKLALGQTSNLANVQSASLLGAYFVAFLMVLTSALIAVAIFKIRACKKKAAVLCLLLAVVIFVSNNLYGNIRLINTPKGGNTIKVSAIQANISSDDKWSNDVLYTLETYEKLTAEAVKCDPDIVIWPESALPYSSNLEGSAADYISRINTDYGVDLIVGTFYETKDDLYNVTVYVDADEEMFSEMYAKRKLVPFGEFVPMRKIISVIYPPLSDLSVLSEDITAGEDSDLFETDHGKIGSLICFDSIYESVVRDTVKDGAELLCISTNDSWFHDSSAVYEHNNHAVLRSIENGRYTVRCANTGISSIITDRGTVTHMLEPLKQGVLSGDVKLLNYTTLYTAVGNLLVWICIAYSAVQIAYTVIKDINNGYTHRQRKRR